MGLNNFSFDGIQIPDPPKKKKKIGRKILAVALVVWGIYHAFTSDMFETADPVIEMVKVEYWNLKDPINLKISDNRAIKSYKISIDNGDGELFDYASGSFEEEDTKRLEFNITIPKTMTLKSSYTTIVVEATDFSNWNFFNGNRASLKETFTVDNNRPMITVINTSYGIRRGGAATVIFKVDEEAIDKVYIESLNGKRFIPQPFLRDDGKYFISLVAWPINDVSFKGKIIAQDKAGNSSEEFLNLYLKEKRYKVSNMVLKESFLTGKIASLAQEHEKSSYTDIPSELFKIVNEDIRGENEKLIYEVTSKVDTKKVVDEFYMQPFSPLKGSTSVASFGDHRKFHYNDSLISESYHMGLDLASVKMAPIISSNRGEIKYVGDNGVYGLTPIIDHGLGLYSIYSHCSSVRVQEGDLIDKDHIIGNSGKTGLALGDHLHFGVYVQGVPVRPEEWMDKDWIKNNVVDIIANAKQTIERQSK